MPPVDVSMPNLSHIRNALPYPPNGMPRDSKSIRNPFEIRSKSGQFPLETLSDSGRNPSQIRSNSARYPFEIRSKSARNSFELRSKSIGACKELAPLLVPPLFPHGLLTGFSERNERNEHRGWTLASAIVGIVVRRHVPKTSSMIIG